MTRSWVQDGGVAAGWVQLLGPGSFRSQFCPDLVGWRGGEGVGQWRSECASPHPSLPPQKKEREKKEKTKIEDWFADGVDGVVVGEAVVLIEVGGGTDPAAKYYPESRHQGQSG